MYELILNELISEQNYQNRNKKGKELPLRFLLIWTEFLLHNALNKNVDSYCSIFGIPILPSTALFWGIFH